MTLEDGRMSIEISAYGENNRLLYDQTYGVNSERVLVGAIHMGSPELPEFPRMGGTPDDDIDVVGLPQKHFASITPFVPVSGTVRTLENALLREFQNDVNKSMQFNQSAIV